MKDLLREIATKEYLVLYFMGLLALFVATLIEPASDLGTAVFWMRKAVSLLDAAGYTLIITTLVASILNFYFLRSIEARFSIVGGAEASRIIDLFPNRKASLPSIEHDISRVDTSVDIHCISGTDLLQPRCPVLKEVDRRCRHGSNINVRVLLLDPRSRHAIERSIREEQASIEESEARSYTHYNKKLCADTLLALRQLNAILVHREKRPESSFKLEVRLANTAPFMHYIRIGNSVYVEQYHLGIPSSEAESTATKCLGKVIPSLKFPVTSDAAKVLGDHFDYVWKQSKHCKVVAGTVEVLEASLRNGDWYEKYVALVSEEQKALALHSNNVVQ